MSNLTVSAQQICEQIQELPEESLDEIARFIEFLRFKEQRAESEERVVVTGKLARLEGLLKGYDFSPEVLAEARREMWREFQDPRHV